MVFRKRDEIEAREGRNIAAMAQQGASSVLYSALIVAAVLIAILLAPQLPTVWDLSRQDANTLSPQTQSVLSGLERDVKLYALYTRRNVRVYENYWNLLARFEQTDPSGRLSFEFADPIKDPGIVARLQLDPERDQLQSSGVTVAVSGERRVTFRGDDEEAVTNALLEVARSGRHVVGFVRGYGEKDPQASGAGGMASAVEALQREYYEVRDVVLAEGIPPEVEALIVAGPKLPIPSADQATLSRWLKRGGRLLALLEPNDPSGLDAVLDEWGLSNERVQVYDPESNINRSQVFLKVTRYGRHEIVRGFGENYPVALPVAGAVDHYESGDPEVYHTELLLSGLQSFGLDASGKQRFGPLPLAAAAWKQGEVGGEQVATRVLLIGDADFASSAYLPMQANRNLFLNGVAWLCRQSELVSIRRDELAGQKINLSKSDPPLIYTVSFLAPTLVLLAGVVVALRRRGL